MSPPKNTDAPPWAINQEKLMQEFASLREEITALKTAVEDAAAVMPEIKDLLEREQKRRVITEFFSSSANFIVKVSAFIGAFAIVVATFKKEIKIFLGIS